MVANERNHRLKVCKIQFYIHFFKFINGGNAFAINRNILFPLCFSLVLIDCQYLAEAQENHIPCKSGCLKKLKKDQKTIHIFPQNFSNFLYH